MPKLTSKTDGNRSVSPAGYELYSVSITLNNGNVSRIDELVQTIEIVESLQTSSIQVIMRLFDGSNYLEESHLSGGEKVNIKLRRTENLKESFSKSRNRFDIEVYIAAIVGHSRPKPGLQAYNIECLSKQALISNTKKLNRSFNGNIGQLVSNIFTNDLQLKTEEDFILSNLSDSSDIIKGIYPNLSPLETLSWLTRNASNDGTPYFLYETIQEGMQFRSYNDIINDDLYRSYNDASFSTTQTNTPGAYNEEQRKILNMSSDLNRSMYDSINSGAYSARLHTLDIATKNYKQSDFNYNNTYSMNEHVPFSTNIQFDDNSIDKYTTNKQYYVSLNSRAFSQDISYHKPAVTSLMSKQSYFENLGFMGLDIELNGDFNLTVGKKVNIIVPKAKNDITQMTGGKLSVIDKYIGGVYIVASISHFFSPNDYKCNLGLQKDSLSFDLDKKIELGKNNTKQTRRGRRRKTGNGN